MQNECVFVGMDLGSFKTSVASSAGVRDVVNTAVGWPKDHVARSLLGRDVVFGKDLIEHRLAVHIVRPFEKGALKYTAAGDVGVPLEKVELHTKAAKLLVEHAVSLTRAAAEGRADRLPGVIGLRPARVTRPTTRPCCWRQPATRLPP